MAMDPEVDTIEKIAASLPETGSVLITGGEPFLREDIFEILRIFKEAAPDTQLSLNTNGTRPGFILETVRLFFSRGWEPLGLSVSLDGPDPIHNAMRGSICAHRAIETLNGLRRLKSVFPRLHLSVNTLLTPKTLDLMPDFLINVADRFDPDFHNLELERDNPVHFDPLDLKNFYAFYLEHIRTRYPAKYDQNLSRIRIQYGNLINGERWGLPCHAGRGDVVLYPDLSLAACEMRPPVLKLDKETPNLAKALSGRRMAAEVEQLHLTNCDCIHGCWLMTSMMEMLDQNEHRHDYSWLLDLDEARRYFKIGEPR